MNNLTYATCNFLNSRSVLERKLADADVSEEDQNNLLKFLEKKETEYMRLKRHKMGADDFELLTMIGKGAFGEVNSSQPVQRSQTCFFFQFCLMTCSACFVHTHICHTSSCFCSISASWHGHSYCVCRYLQTNKTNA